MGRRANQGNSHFLTKARFQQQWWGFKVLIRNYVPKQSAWPRTSQNSHLLTLSDLRSKEGSKGTMLGQGGESVGKGGRPPNKETQNVKWCLRYKSTKKKKSLKSSTPSLILSYRPLLQVWTTSLQTTRKLIRASLCQHICIPLKRFWPKIFMLSSV